MSEALLDDLRQAVTPPPPRNFSPGVVYAGGAPSIIVTPPVEAMENEDEWLEAVKAMGVPLPAGHTLQLVEAAYAYTENVWKRDKEDRGTEHSAYSGPNHRWSYKFRVVPKSLRDDLDYQALLKEVAKKVKARKPLLPKAGREDASMVVALADFQVSKVDELGGTPELLERSETALALVKQQIKAQRPAEILLVDPGDSTEGFNSAPNADRTNDLQETEAIRVWRRLFWRWISELAAYGIPMKVISVPSNHCRNRRGKNAVGPIDDDWGLEVLAQVSDMASVNPAAYAHVEFIAPRKHDEHVTLTLVGGKVISFAHGHQVSNPNQMTDWAKRQGRREVGLSDIVVVGHFHHLRCIAYGDRQWLFICPTMDSGSSWFTPSSGEQSDPGVLTFMVDSNGWRDIFVAWAAV